ncbi:hypothetical protein EVAR_46242_1 [Eumeta japonica]|uniref:Uncharacterized protein n=1 Tax=Eumeta variegata TaxID=151549 RepID=A0A4C1XLY6_EUMVA|nr:hypothetical protein EVAR_46242_1 [Eumeta japonica]
MAGGDRAASSGYQDDASPCKRLGKGYRYRLRRTGVSSSADRPLAIRGRAADGDWARAAARPNSWRARLRINFIYTALFKREELKRFLIKKLIERVSVRWLREKERIRSAARARRQKRTTSADKNLEGSAALTDRDAAQSKLHHRARNILEFKVETGIEIKNETKDKIECLIKIKMKNLTVSGMRSSTETKT